MTTAKLAICLLLGVVVGAARVMAQGSEKVSLTFFWHAGDRANLLLEIAREYTRETGVEVQAILPPLTDEYYQRIASEFAKKGSAFDLCMFDSQSMSEFASQGHIVRLNEWLKSSPRVSAADFDPLALKRYAEYPDDSGNIYALPINQDCMGLVYRKDLFEDAEEQAAFKRKYGYDLGVPQDYDQLRDIAEFFTRPAQQQYGIALFGSREYDGCTSAFNSILWSFGGELWEPLTGRALGHINSATAKQALEFYKGLFAWAPPGFQDAYVQEVNKAVESGQVAMAIQWYYYFDELAAATASTPYRLGFAALPGQKGADGKFRRLVMVGGQGVSVSQYSKNKQEAWKFLEWFMLPEQQWKWVRGGGKTGLASILKDEKFLSASAANSSFALSMSMTRDYWHLPAYARLLQVYQEFVHRAISGELSTQEALDLCAQEHERILRDNGAQTNK